MKISNYAFELTKLYMSKKVLNNCTPEQYTKDFFDTYTKIFVFLKSNGISFND